MSVGVWEVACSGGRDIADIILPPEVNYEATRVVVTLRLEPLPTLAKNEAFTCALAPPVSYTLKLSEPLGNRALVDGSQPAGGDAMWGGLIDPRLLGSWELVEGTLDGQGFVPIHESAVTFAVRGNAAGGHGGCNAYIAEPVTVRADGISIAQPSSHLAGCPDGRGDVEAVYFRALPRMSGWSLDGGRLALWGEGASLSFRRLTAD